MNWFKLECTTRAFVTALQLTVRYEMSVIIIIIIIKGGLSHTLNCECTMLTKIKNQTKASLFINITA